MNSGASLIVAYGNALRGDDGVGPRIGRLCAEAGRRTIEAPQLFPEHAEAIAQAQLVIFVDCHAGLTPGEVAVMPIESSPDAIHEPASPASLLALAHCLYGAAPVAHLVGVGPASLEYHEGLSDRVEAAIPAALRMIDALLAG